MKEYMPGQGSYKVEEAGGLTGVPMSYNVDNNWGTLILDRDDVKISARGIDLALSSRFSSDHLYSTIIPKVAKDDGPFGYATVAVPDSLMTLPADQTNFYRIANGWSWKLPHILLGMPNAFKFTLGDGRLFDLLSTITQEAWNDGKGDHHTWTEGYEVTYSAEHSVEGSLVSLITIVLPEIQATIVVDVERDPTTEPANFTPIWSSNLVVYLSDGRALRFNRHGFIESASDMAGRNRLTYSYVADSLSGMTGASYSRRQFDLGSATDYDAVIPGDLIAINGEIKVIFSKDHPVSHTITVSGNFDTDLRSAQAYTIYKGQLQKIAHSDGRSVKLYYYTNPGNKCLTIVLSADPEMDNFIEGDQFIGFYTIASDSNLLSKYATCSDKKHATKTGGFTADLAANQSTYFEILQAISYEYLITRNPSPATDRIVATNDVGAPTIYYFQRGGFCTHSWNNAYFHRGACRRGGGRNLLNIERPDFYVQAGNWVNINRIDDKAFREASKDDYQMDENAAEFNSENQFYQEMYQASISKLQGEALSQAKKQDAHRTAKFEADRVLAQKAANVSDWTLVYEVRSPNQLVLAGNLAEEPRQNDIYAVMDIAPDKTEKIVKTSKNSTRIYVDYTKGAPAFAENDYVFLRTECQVISRVGEEAFGSIAIKFIEVKSAFQFVPLENEEVAFVRSSRVPDLSYFCFYLNKPKVVRIEFKDASPLNSEYWKAIDYEYSYEVQGTLQTDSYEDGGFTIDHRQGPRENSFDVSDITLKETSVITGIANEDGNVPLYRDTFAFAYDEKSFHKGVTLETRTRFDPESNSWLFVSRTANSLGRPCFNAGYYGVLSSSYYEGGDVTVMGGDRPRKTTSYRYDVYGRAIRTRTISPFFEGKKTKNSWTQYVGSSPAVADLDPLDKFSENYLSTNYQQLCDAKHALGLVGATIEEVSADGMLKCIFNGFESSTGNLIRTDELISTSLTSFLDHISLNGQDLVANTRNGLNARIDPKDIFWSYHGSADSNDWASAKIDPATLAVYASTVYTYDAATNNLLTMRKPSGNLLSFAYGDSWKSSYIVKDFRTLDGNILGGTQYIVTSYDYDLKGRLLNKTIRLKSDTNGDDTNLYAYGANKTLVEFTFDGMDRLLTKTIGDGSTRTTVLAVQYFDRGDASWVNLPYTVTTDFLGFRTKTYYDSRYRALGVERFKPKQDIGGSLNYEADLEVKIGSEWTYYQPGFEKVAQKYRFTNPNEALGLAVATKYAYDGIGRLTQVQQKNSDQSYQGDAVYRVLQDIFYDESTNAVTTRTYLDESGNFTQTRVEHDWLGRGPTREVQWTGLNATGVQRVLTNHYRHDGKLVKKDLPNRETLRYGYDSAGRLEKIAYPDGTRAALLYDLNGNVIQTIDRRNLSAVVAYNQADLAVKSTTVDVSRGDTVVSTTHTQFGPAQILKKEGAAEVARSDYWYHWSGAVAQQQQTINGHMMQIVNGFDPAGNRITVTPTGSGASPWTRTFNILPQFHPTGVDQDNFNRTAIRDSTTGKNVITHEPDFLGLSKTIKYGDYDAIVARMSLAYDKFAGLRSLVSGEPTPNLNITLARDFAGRVVAHNEPVLSIAYTYQHDGMDRLVSGEGATESYDDLSNLLTRGAFTYAYEDRNDSASADQMRLSSFFDGTATHLYSYDAGNPVGISGRYSSLLYDGLNALRRIVHSQTDDYWYDSAGKRVKRTEASGGTWKTTYTLYEGENPLMQEVYAASGRLQVSFNIILNGQILAQYKHVYPSTSSIAFFYLDNLLSRRVVLDSSGAVTNRFRYSAWGVATTDSGSDEYRSFTGKEYDATGLIYFNARYYDPTTGRFLTEDPSRQGSNWYAYCQNNPVNLTDPDGRDPPQHTNWAAKSASTDSRSKGSGGGQSPRLPEPAWDINSPIPFHPQSPENLQRSKRLLSGAAGFVPYAGAAWDLKKAISGYDDVAEEKLSALDRIVSGISGALGVVPIVGELVGGALKPAIRGTQETIGLFDRLAKESITAGRQPLQVSRSVLARAESYREVQQTLDTVAAGAERAGRAIGGAEMAWTFVQRE